MLSFVKQLYLMKLIRFLFSRIFYKQLFYILILSVIIVVSLIFYLNHSTFHGKSIVVPNLIGKTINEVDQELNKLTLRYEVIDSARYNSNYKPLSVIDHQPTSNSKVKKNRKIYLTINPSNYNQVKIPNIIRTTIRQAKQMLVSSGFVIGKIDYVDDIGKDEVIEISFEDEILKEGDLLLRNSIMNLYMSIILF